MHTPLPLKMTEHVTGTQINTDTKGTELPPSLHVSAICMQLIKTC